jgi:hypothetical protein
MLKIIVVRRVLDLSGLGYGQVALAREHSNEMSDFIKKLGGPRLPEQVVS